MACAKLHCMKDGQGPWRARAPVSWTGPQPGLLSCDAFGIQEVSLIWSASLVKAQLLDLLTCDEGGDIKNVGSKV